MDGSHRTPHSVLGIAELQHHAAQSQYAPPAHKRPRHCLHNLPIIVSCATSTITQRANTCCAIKRQKNAFQASILSLVRSFVSCGARTGRRNRNTEAEWAGGGVNDKVALEWDACVCGSGSHECRAQLSCMVLPWTDIADLWWYAFEVGASDLQALFTIPRPPILQCVHMLRPHKTPILHPAPHSVVLRVSCVSL